DIGESKDLAKTNPEKTQELLKHLEQWRKETGAPIPTEANPNYDAEAEALALAGKGNPKKRGRKKKRN
ncbi:MAG: hypothetical protein QF473_40360, partial [Planctomycetota bacterium]|nr:hypothetical protein [Planctomycetota bacterium]